MKLLRGLHSFVEFSQGVVAAIGNFDGVHLGHQHLMQALTKEAGRKNLPSVLIMFEPQPREYFHKEQAPTRLTSLREKLMVMRSCRVDYVCCIKFDALFAQINATEFATQYLFKQFNIQSLFVGHDFRFGKNREGDITLLQTIATELRREVLVFPEFSVHNERVSSTKIRHALEEGNLSLADSYLGRMYSICGRVVHGAGRGRGWGIPTANLSPSRKNIPLKGVYVVQVKLDDKLVQGVANIGKRPTIDGTKQVLEIHLLQFNQSIYGKLLHVFFIHKLRDELKFASIEQLLGQIHQDIKDAEHYFATNSKSKQL